MNGSKREDLKAHGRPHSMVLTLLVLAVTQIVAWGTIGFPTVLAPEIGIDLGLSQPTVFAGPSVMSIVTAFVSPAFGSAFVQHGARRMLVAGALTAAPGLLLIAAASGPIVYFAGWVLIGIGGAAMLSTGAHIYLNEIAGTAAQSPISVLMLMTGLSSAIFLPLTAAFDQAFGWRGTCTAFALLLAFINVPLILVALVSKTDTSAAEPAAAPSTAMHRRADRLTFLLVAGAVALNAFVTFGITAIGVQLFRGLGLTTEAAIAFASIISVVQVTARGLDLVVGRLSRRGWDGLKSGILATAILPIGLSVPILWGSGSLCMTLFVALYGFASGVLAVARSTMPLRFYNRTDYARILSRIGFPLNLTVAVSPPLMAGLLTGYGPDAVLLLGVGTCLLALALLLFLSRRPAFIP